jgi:hypothetical protein
MIAVGVMRVAKLLALLVQISSLVFSIEVKRQNFDVAGGWRFDETRSRT